MACCIVEEDLVYIEPFCWISLSQELTSPPKDLCTVHSGNRCSTLNPYLKWSTKLDNSPHSSLFLHTLLNLLKDDHHHQQLLPCQSFSAPSRDLDSGDPDLWSMMPLPLFLPSQNQSRKLGHLCSWCWPLEDHHGQILPGGRSAQVPAAIFLNVPYAIEVNLSNTRDKHLKVLRRDTEPSPRKSFETKNSRGCVIVTVASRRKILVTQLKSGISSTKVLHIKSGNQRHLASNDGRATTLSRHFRPLFRRRHFPDIGMQLLAISGYPSSFWSSYWRASQAQRHLCYHCWTRMPSGPAALAL